MIHYLTGANEAHIRAVLVGLYEATTGTELPKDETGQKVVPQNDGRLQFHHLFADWIITPGVPDPDKMGAWLTPPVTKPGYHCAIGIIPSEDNPEGLIGPNDTAMLESAGIEVLRANEIDTTHLPKFQ